MAEQIIIDGIKIKYTDTGFQANAREADVATVVILHGWGCSTIHFKQVSDHLRTGFRVVCIDMPGFGESGAPPETWGTPEYARCIRSFLQAKQIKRPILIGHSFGGKICIYLTGALGVDTQKMILTGSTGIKPKRKMRFYVRVYTFKFIKTMLSLPGIRKYTKFMLDNARSYFGSADYKNANSVLRTILSRVVNEDYRDIMPKVKIPVLLYWGEQDTAAPLSDGKQMEKLFPDAGLVVAKGAGHFAYAERMGEFLLILDSFLKS